MKMLQLLLMTTTLKKIIVHQIMKLKMKMKLNSMVWNGDMPYDNVRNSKVNESEADAEADAACYCCCR